MPKLCKNCGMMTVPSLHVCNPVAVRDPKPAPTVKPRSIVAKKKRTGRVVVRKLWTQPGDVADNNLSPLLFSRKPSIKGDEPFLLLPADAACVERMVEQVGKELAWMSGQPFGDQARAALAAIGIFPAR